MNQEMEALRGGYFVEHVRGKQIKHKNTLVQYGASSLLRTVFRAEAVFAGTWYLGLTNAAYTFDQAGLLAALVVGEPVGNGYARQAITRNTVDWTVSEVNGVLQVVSKVVTFTCAGGNWDKVWLRGFLCDANAGGAGNVIAVSGPAPSARQVTVGNGPQMNYTYYLRG